MSTYTLNIAFAKEDAQKINQIGEKVVLVKQNTPANAQNQVAWVTFDPFENNVVTWTESYYVYASTSEVQHGSKISKVSYEDAGDSCVYDFTNNVFNLDPTKKLPAGTIGAINQTNNDLTFGLAQNVSVNNSFYSASPINATTVLVGQNANFTPLEQVSVCLLNNTMDGLVLTTVYSNTYEAMFGNGVDNISILYRDGNFVKV